MSLSAQLASPQSTVDEPPEGPLATLRPPGANPDTLGGRALRRATTGRDQMAIVRPPPEGDALEAGGPMGLQRVPTRSSACPLVEEAIRWKVPAVGAGG